MFCTLALVFVNKQHRSAIVTAELEQRVVDVFVGTARCEHGTIRQRSAASVVDALGHEMPVAAEFRGSAERCRSATGSERSFIDQVVVAADL